MELAVEKFIVNIAKQFTYQDPAKLSPDTKLRDIEGYSSLESLFIMLMVDEIYNVNLTEEDMIDSTTIEELFNRIKSKK